MGKYKNHEELAAYAPWKWRRNTTRQSYLDGMNRIAPPGKKARERRGTNFEERTALPQSVEWHHNWDIALFDGSEIEHPTSQSRQRSLEEAFPPPKKEPYLPPYPDGKESFPPAGAFLPHTVKKQTGEEDVKEYRVEENKGYGTWAVVELWSNGTIRSPFESREEAIKREEEIGRYYGWKLRRVEKPSEKGKAKRRLMRGDVRVEIWAERDRLHIGIQDKGSGEYIASWWDDEAREMMEQGFFYCPGSLGWRIPAEQRKLEESVLSYAEEQGLLIK